MTLEAGGDMGSELEKETKTEVTPVTAGKVACYWLPSGKCMLSPPGKRTEAQCGE